MTFKEIAVYCELTHMSFLKVVCLFRKMKKICFLYNKNDFEIENGL